jgi:hypothetical protein
MAKAKDDYWHAEAIEADVAVFMFRVAHCVLRIA